MLVPNFFKKEELEPALKGIEGLVDKLAEKLYQAGKIKGNYNYGNLNFTISFQWYIYRLSYEGRSDISFIERSERGTFMISS